MRRIAATSHASVLAYPNAVISLKDPATGNLFYVERDGRTLVAFDNDGRVKWTVDLIGAVKTIPAIGYPVIRHLRLEGEYLWVTIGKNDSAKVQTDTGKVTYVGAG